MTVHFGTYPKVNGRQVGCLYTESASTSYNYIFDDTLKFLDYRVNGYSRKEEDITAYEKKVFKSLSKLIAKYKLRLEKCLNGTGDYNAIRDSLEGETI